MARKPKLHKNLSRFSWCPLLMIALLLMLRAVEGRNTPKSSDLPDSTSPQEVQKAAMARQLAFQHSMDNFEPSLEMKEHADFLLTPALLVQEAISEDVIMTYPTE